MDSDEHEQLHGPPAEEHAAEEQSPAERVKDRTAGSGGPVDQAVSKAYREANKSALQSIHHRYRPQVPVGAARTLTRVSKSASDYYCKAFRPGINAILRKALDTAAGALAFYPVLVAERVHLFWRCGWGAAAHMNLGNNALELGQIQSLLLELTDQPNEIVREALDNRMPAYFREQNHTRLRHMIQSWQSTPAFETRQGIFEEALEAHIQGRDTTAVHLLVPHVEGIFRDITGTTGASGRNRWQTKVDKAFGFKRGKGGRWMSDPAGAAEDFRKLDKYSRFKEMWRLDTEAALLSFDELYEKNDSDGSYRNRIAHGQIIVCTEADSIRIFCLLDQLSRVTRLYHQYR